MDRREIDFDDCDSGIGHVAVVGHEVPRVRTVPEDARVEDRDLGTTTCQIEREVRSDEAEATGDQAPPTGKGVVGNEVQRSGQLRLRSATPLFSRGTVVTTADMRTSPPDTSHIDRPPPLCVSRSRRAHELDIGLAGERASVLDAHRCDTLAR